MEGVGFSDRVVLYPEVQSSVVNVEGDTGRWERAGRFPKRVHCSSQMVGWKQSELAQWMLERAAERLVSR